MIHARVARPARSMQMIEQVSAKILTPSSRQFALELRKHGSTILERRATRNLFMLNCV